MTCEDCHRPIATQRDHDTVGIGEGEHLCWRPWNPGDSCIEPPINWRARAIAAEAELAAMRLAYLDETHGDCDPATVGAADIRELREAFREQGDLIRGIVIRLGVEIIDDVVPLVEAMRPVVAAADAWRECTCKGLGSHKEAALSDAVDAYRARKATP